MDIQRRPHSPGRYLRWLRTGRSCEAGRTGWYLGTGHPAEERGRKKMAAVEAIAHRNRWFMMMMMMMIVIIIKNRDVPVRKRLNCQRVTLWPTALGWANGWTWLNHVKPKWMNFCTHQWIGIIYLDANGDSSRLLYVYNIYIYMHSQLSYLDLVGFIWNLNGIKQQTIYGWFTIEIETTKNKWSWIWVWRWRIQFHWPLNIGDTRSWTIKHLVAWCSEKPRSLI